MITENLNTDELSGKVFGNYRILGWVGKKSYNKIYLFQCSVCCKDSELFGDGTFKAPLYNIQNAKSCGCNKSFLWSEDQYKILCKRKALEKGLEFNGFSEDFNGAVTKIRLVCPEHGEWKSTSINNFRSKNVGCPLCKVENLGKASKKPDDQMISSFFASGGFADKTVFVRSDKQDSRGRRPYWYCSCPECGETYTAHFNELQRGRKKCSCKEWKPRFLYVNVVEDGTLPIAIKFGITNNLERRNREQNTHSPYDIKNLFVFEFTDHTACRETEKQIKSSLTCGVIPRYSMKDGWTETTSILNLDWIKSFCEKQGAVAA